jgi:hypothetical protein
MNMNRIMNMILRIIMRKAINSGINSGMKAVSGKGRKKPQPAVENTGYIEPRAMQEQPRLQPADDGKLSQAQVRERRRARQAVRQARQQQKASNGPS